MDHLLLADRQTAMSAALTRKLSGYFAVSNETGRLIVSLCDDLVRFEPGATLTAQGGPYGAVLLIESGWVLRSRVLESGARQIVNVAIPGDFVGLNALLFRSSDFEHVARTPVAAWRMKPDRTRDAFGRIANLASALFWANAHEEAMLAERIVSLGRRSARTRAAHVLCEFISRLEIINGTVGREFILPISQDDFADILGISLVHMNTILRALDREGVITFRNGLLLVHDRKRLEHVAGFDDGYLHFTRRADLFA